MPVNDSTSCRAVPEKTIEERRVDLEDDLRKTCGAGLRDVARELAANENRRERRRPA